MIKIDGEKYNVEWISDSLEQTAEILNGENSGRLQGTYEMYLQYGATFLNHKGEILKTSKCSWDEWNEVFRVLMNPKNDHTIVFPFQNGEIELNVYIAKISRKLKFIKETNQWGKTYDVSFVSMSPCWVVNKNLKEHIPYDNS